MVHVLDENERAGAYSRCRGRAAYSVGSKSPTTILQGGPKDTALKTQACQTGNVVPIGTCGEFERTRIVSRSCRWKRSAGIEMAHGSVHLGI